MPGPARKPYAVSQSQARRIWLHAQRLDVPAPFGGGAEATRLAVEHLGYVQIDTIHVIERCHHHILYNRIPSYARGDLHRAQSLDKTVFEYWTHALAYLPVHDMRFYIAAMKAYAKTPSRWYGSVTGKDLRKVLGLIRDTGPLTIRDIEDDVLVEKDHPWASRKPSKRALQFAFHIGAVTISARSGMLKTYELTSRHFGWDSLPKAASERDIVAYLLDRALRSQGLVSLTSACYGNAARKMPMRALIEARLRRKELVPVVIDGAEKAEHWASPTVLEETQAAADERVHILSPFDPLIIQRKRLELFFGYEHRFEAYVPPQKRVYGYFALPVLAGDEIVAAIDLKADRAAQMLLIQKWTWVGNGTPGLHKHMIEAELERFERFQLS